MSERHLTFRLAAIWLLLCAALVAAQPSTLGPAEQIADGVVLYRLADPGLLDPAGPIAVQALRLDPKKIALEMGVAGDGVPARLGVLEIASRRQAVAAVNGGFFALEDGRPLALLKSRGRLLAGTGRSRGAVGVMEKHGGVRLLFDRVTAGIVSGKNGRREGQYWPRLGTSSKDWSRVSDAVSGAGLLVLDGRELKDWADEGLSPVFDTTRHPRTLIGVDGDDAIWLVTIDGRNPALSLGMRFTEMQGLARRLGLRSALNLDGGGSTTMVVNGRIVNHPSDPTGPRPVSDALLVLPRKR
jgi:exopolysaccharide biosynthesis protein